MRVAPAIRGIPFPKEYMPSHAKYFSPSKADTWMSCTASPAYCETLARPDRSTEAAEEGTAAHELLETCIASGIHPRKFKSKMFNKVWPATDEMIFNISLVYEWFLAFQLDGWKTFSEQQVKIAATGDKGTLDMAAIKKRHLRIADLKYGRGHPVSPVENKQMRLYACGMLDTHKLWTKVDAVTLTIWQPRIVEEAQEWRDTVANLMAFRDQTQATVKNIETGNVVFAPGEKTCQWCLGKATCKAFAKHANEQAALDFAQITTGPVATPTCESMTVEELVNIHQNADTVRDWLKSVSGFLFDEAMAGRIPPGTKLVRGETKRKWANEGDTMDSLHRLGYEADQFAPRSLAGIGDIGRLFKDKKLRASFLAQHTTKPEGRPILAGATDVREAYVADEFAQIPIDDNDKL